MRIATWNLLKGGSRRIHWSRLFDEFQVDLLCVQESAHPDEHLPPLLHPESRGCSAWLNVPKRSWGSAVAVRTGAVTALTLPGFKGWVTGAEVRRPVRPDGSSETFLAFSLHAPDKPGGYANAVLKILDDIRNVARGHDIVIGGDFNLSLLPSPHEKPANKRMNSIVRARLADEFGLVNCWKAANPDAEPAQTLRWTKDRTTPFHCDGLFVPRRWLPQLKSCVVLSGDDWNQLSDHNPVIAQFQ